MRFTNETSQRRDGDQQKSPKETQRPKEKENSGSTPWRPAEKEELISTKENRNRGRSREIHTRRIRRVEHLINRSRGRLRRQSLQVQEAT
ncbi:unnamed protein product [Microthlaspi erraticum]|uniref:Uncharacterized protein n=1 Tax=Microthlaspi erraticum TaxID=1685480 RepID=A0A6D2J4W6_9BRAS|nr:unnamed protein product [Microthlaspi erraticum]